MSRRVVEESVTSRCLKRQFLHNPRLCNAFAATSLRGRSRRIPIALCLVRRKSLTEEQSCGCGLLARSSPPHIFHSYAGLRPLYYRRASFVPRAEKVSTFILVGLLGDILCRASWIPFFERRLQYLPTFKYPFKPCDMIQVSANVQNVTKRSILSK